MRIESITAAELKPRMRLLWDSETEETVTVTDCYPLFSGELIWVELSNGEAGAEFADQEFSRVH